MRTGRPVHVRVHHNRRRQTAGLSVIELLVVIALIALLGAFVLAGIARARSSAQVVQCMNNLRQIGVGFIMYASDNSSRLPDPLALETTWESQIKPYLQAGDLFRCPADEEVFPALGSSYDWRDSGRPETSAANRSIHACRPDAVLAFEALPGWHKARSMIAVRIDGSALMMGEQECLKDLRRPVTIDGSMR